MEANWTFSYHKLRNFRLPKGILIDNSVSSQTAVAHSTKYISFYNQISDIVNNFQGTYYIITIIPDVSLPEIYLCQSIIYAC